MWWVCNTSLCGEFVIHHFVVSLYNITLWWVCIKYIPLWWVCILHHFVVGLHYIILWWVCNISLCGEIVFHHFVLHHCSGLVLHHCGEFVIHPCVVSGSSLLWCFYIIYFVVILFSMVHSILVRFYYFPLLFIIYDFDRSQMIFASILFKDTDHLLINLSGNVPGSRVTVPKNQPSIFLW